MVPGVWYDAAPEPMTEPVVALTDFLVALECGLLGMWLARERTAREAWAWLLLFGSIGFAALMGGISHGFFPDDARGPGLAVWQATLAGLGLTAVALWTIAGGLLGGAALERTIARLAAVAYLPYLGVVAFVSQDFKVAIVAYLPAIVALAAALTARLARGGSGASLALAGVAVTVLATVAQQARIALHPTYVDHNALYHVLQMGALGLFFVGSRRLLGRAEPVPATAAGR
jgi:hypothetical protein